jgi:hypothetical protein
MLYDGETTSSLRQVGQAMDVVYTADMVEAVKVIQACFSFRRDQESTPDASTGRAAACSVLVGVVMGSTVADNVQQEVLAALSGGPYVVNQCCCKPSEVSHNLHQLIITSE